MNDDDKAMDRLIQQVLARSNAAPGAGPCLDAEVIAAWSEGALSPADVAPIETHLSQCARCQELLAALAVSAPLPQPSPSLWQRWRLQWLVPITAAATAIAIWVAIPSGERPGSPQVANVPSAATPSPAPSEVPSTVPPVTTSGNAIGTVSPDAGRSAPSTVVQTPPEAARSEALMEAEGRSLAGESASRLATAVASSPLNDAQRKDDAAPGNQAGPVSAAPPQAVAAAERTARPLEESRALPQRRGGEDVEILSPNSANRWRIVGGTRIEHSTDGGTRWVTTVVTPPGVLRAGASPGETVCWLVGTAGDVRLTTDGIEFGRVPFPESLDLVAVQATSASEATVASVDGRRFRTDNRGQTWVSVAP